MKTLKVVLIVIMVLLCIAGCSYNQSKVDNNTNNSKKNSKLENSELENSISPTKTEDIGFAYRDKYMELIVVVSGQGWKYKSYTEEQSVYFYNENIPTQGDINIIALASADKEEEIDAQIQEAWKRMVDRLNINEYKTSDTTLGAEFNGIEQQLELDDGSVGEAVGGLYNGTEYQFENDYTIGKAVFWEGTDNLYFMLLLCEKEYSNIFIEAYESIIDTFMEFREEE